MGRGADAARRQQTPFGRCASQILGIPRLLKHPARATATTTKTNAIASFFMRPTGADSIAQRNGRVSSKAGPAAEAVEKLPPMLLFGLSRHAAAQLDVR
jgi:hypothetical protein